MGNQYAETETSDTQVENDHLWKSEILGRRQETPRWADEPVWWLWRILVNIKGLGSIHNNNQQSLGFKHSLIEDW